MNVFDLPDTEAWYDREPASLDIVDRSASCVSTSIVKCYGHPCSTRPVIRTPSASRYQCPR